MLSPALNALTPSPAPQAAHAPASAGGGDDASQASFARSLQQARQARPETAARDKAEKPARPKDAAEKSDKAQATDKAESSRDEDQDDASEGATRPHDGPADALNQLLPGWNPALPRADAASPRDAAAAQEAAEEGGTGPTAAGTGRKRTALPGAADAARDARTAAPAAADPRFDAALSDAAPGRATKTEAAAADTGRAPVAQAPASVLQTGSPGPQGAAQGTGPSAAAAAPFEARLSAALGGPDFAPALGVQVSLFVREGVQEARLHLNPAEMGPIAVQIALEGQNAQVHFQADHAATREALQASLPELAAALQDNGFTLSGGGVSDPHRDASASQDGAANRDRQAAGVTDARPDARDGATAAATGPVRTPRPRGVVDLYA